MIENKEDGQFPESLKKLGYTEEGLAADNPYTAHIGSIADDELDIAPATDLSAQLQEVDMLATQHHDPLVIYHGNCMDGFSAAWVFHHMEPIIEQSFDYYPGVYSKTPPEVHAGQTVYLVDFSYKMEVVKAMVDKGVKVILIDHHKTALEDLAPLIQDRSIKSYVDIKRSGAMLAWDYWNNFRKDGYVAGNDVTCEEVDAEYIVPPPMLDYVQDRDLWQFKLEGSREVSAFMFSHEYSFEVWDKLMFPTPIDLLNWRLAGAGIERKQQKDIKEFADIALAWMNIKGETVPVVNCPYIWASDTGHYLLQKFPYAPFVATYFDTETDRKFSFRSEDRREDCSKYAETLGGGGHRNASGASVALNQYYKIGPTFDVNPPGWAAEGFPLSVLGE